jgi:calcineurin-like phosphoesterase family protein
MEEMNEKLIENHNAIVGKDDTVYNLGDFSWKPALTGSIVSRLNGTQILITGNHDSCHPMHKNAEIEKQKYLDAGFKEVHQQLEVEEFVLNHFPFVGDEYDDVRFGKWRAPKTDKWLIYGHTHQANPISQRGQINVGVDAWEYKPVSIDDLRKKIEHYNILHS